MQKKQRKTSDQPDPQTVRAQEPARGDFPFCGAEANPVFGDNRHVGRDTTYLEVTPEELIDVAKHLGAQGESHRKAVEKAYQLICEAHLVSRNIRLWNEKVSRHHSSESIFQLVEAAPHNSQGQPLRQPLLVAFFKSQGQSGDATNASKRFNEWFKDSARLDDYSRTVPWNPSVAKFDPQLHSQLVENGWINWFQVGSEGYLTLPSRKRPATPLPRKTEKDQHPTRGYWDTEDVWWPEADVEGLEKRKSEYLNKGRDAFLSDHMARRALEKFERWLDLQARMQQRPEARKPPKGSTGAFVSPKHGGAGRNSKGRFGKKDKS